MEDTTKLLELLVAEVRQLRREVGSQLPLVLSLRAAARELSIGLTKLRRLVATGKIATTAELGKRQGIPRSEILRLATPIQVQSAPPRREPAPQRKRGAAVKAVSEAEKIRARIRAERAELRKGRRR